MTRTESIIAQRAKAMTDAELRRAYDAPRPYGVPAMRHARRCDIYGAELTARRDAADRARLAGMVGDRDAIRAAFMEEGSAIFYDAMMALEA